MLTPDLVRARVRGDQLELQKLTKAQQEHCLELLKHYLAIVEAQPGASRDELEKSWALVPRAPRERKLADGLLKMVRDACVFSENTGQRALELRKEVFHRAAAHRRSLRPGQRFERQEVLEQSAHVLGMTPAALAEALFSDLRGAERLERAPVEAAEALLEAYVIGQVQAVLLKAVRLEATVMCKEPAGYRRLFQSLKFRGLMARIEPAEEGYRLEIDGPFSLFESSTKYGLSLALAYRALAECDRLELEATLRWGPRGKAVKFRVDQKHRPTGLVEAQTVLPRPEVARLLESLEERQLPWEVSTTPEVLHLPGVGVCVPDLTFVDPVTKQKVYLEVLGYWSRDAVWQRIEMVEKGLSAPMLFVASSRLRVSESMLDAEDSAALYMFKGSISASQVCRRIETLFVDAGRARR